MKAVYVFTLLSILIQAVIAVDVIYSVIVSSPSTDTGVIVDNKVYVLKPSAESHILHQGSAPCDLPYSYVQLERGTDKIVDREKFSRAATSQNTVNEFYGRNWNTKELVTFETITSITKNCNRRTDFEEFHPIGEIPTIHVMAKQSDIDTIHTRYLQDINIAANVTYISTNTVNVFSDVKFEIGGRSSRYFTKFAYNIKLNKNGEGLGGYKKLKLRTTVADPSYIHEYLTTEMLNAANQPVSRASYVRAIGLFSLLEKYDKTWLANEFAAGSKDYAHGILYEGEGGGHSNRADLSYKGDDPSSYESSAYTVAEKSEEGVESLNDIVSFIKFIDDQRNFQKTANATAISATMPLWEKQIDVEGFLVSMAFEFMHGIWDGYLHNSNNYFLYKETTQNRLIWIPWDFDFIMGSGPVNMKKLSVGDYNNYDGVDSRPLMVAILNVPEYRALFEKHLESIVNLLYNPVKSYPVIDSVVNLIQDDVAWDKTLPHVRKGSEFFINPLSNLINGNSNNGTNQNQNVPSSFSLTTAAELLIRTNSEVSFSKAINGKTGHKSLYGVKEWIKTKFDNYERKTTYKPLLPIPLKN